MEDEATHELRVVLWILFLEAGAVLARLVFACNRLPSLRFVVDDDCTDFLLIELMLTKDPFEW